MPKFRVTMWPQIEVEADDADAAMSAIERLTFVHGIKACWPSLSRVVDGNGEGFIKGVLVDMNVVHCREIKEEEDGQVSESGEDTGEEPVTA